MQYQFTLIDYTTDANGIATIIEEPNGWDGFELMLKRDEQTHGVFFNCSVDSLEFYGIGADIIKAAYLAKKIEAKVDILIEIKCDDCADFESLYNGKLIFAKYKYTQKDDCFVSIGVEEKGSLIQFRNKIDTKVSLDNSDKAALPFVASIPSKGILKTSELAILEDSVIDGQAQNDPKRIPRGAGVTSIISKFRNFSLGFTTEIKNEVDSLAGLSDNAESLNDVEALYILEESGTYNINLNINVRCMAWAFAQNNQVLGGTSLSYGGYNTMYAELYIRIAGVDYLLDSNNTTTWCIDGLANTTLPRTDGKNPTIDLSGTYTASHALNVGDKIYLYVRLQQDGQYHMTASKGDISWVQSVIANGTNTFDINFISYFPATDCQLYAINETFAEITENITTNDMTIYSDFFGRTDAEPYTSTADGCGSLMAVTKGEKIRNLLIQNQTPKLELSFKDVFDAMNCIYNIGIGIEPDTFGANDKLIRIEPVEYFYSNSVLLTCDNVDEVILENIESKSFQTIEIGFEKYEAEEATGVDEFLTKHEYSTKSTQVSNKLERVCKFVAGGYTWEITRRVGHDDTSDWRYDKETFVICLERSGGNMVVEQGNITSSDKIVDPPTILNYRITPIRMMMNWFKSVAAGLIDYTTDSIFYTSGLGNVFATGKNNNGCIIEATTLAENDNIDYSKFSNVADATPLWQPITATFKYPLSYTEFKALQLNPNGLINFSHSDSTFTSGYILELAYVPTDGIATFKLLLKA